MQYYFDSVGPKGVIRKVVRFELWDAEMMIYNLAFGDVDSTTGLPDDKIKSNNGDRDTVMATIGMIVLEFMKAYPDSVVHAKGFSPSRTRLYQMAIASNFAEVSMIFSVMGYIKGEWKPFARGINYEQLLVRVL